MKDKNPIPEFQAGWRLFEDDHKRAEVGRWVEALESGEFRQTKNCLFDGTGHDAMGVGCRALGIEPVLNDGFWWFCGRRGFLPAEAQLGLGLLSFDGAVRDETDQYVKVDRYRVSLVNLNDLWGADFPQIAKFIRDAWMTQFGEEQ